MSERKQAEQFNQAWEGNARQLEGNSSGKSQDAVQQALDIAHQISRLDYSGESQLRESLRRQLQAEYAALPQVERGKFNWTRGLAALGSVAGLAILMICFVLSFSWIIRTILPGGIPASEGPPGVVSLPPTTTPLPTIPTFPETPGVVVVEESPAFSATSPAIAAIAETPAQTLEALAPVLGVESLPDTIRWEMQNPVWDSLWLQGQSRSQDEQGNWQTVFGQAWLRREGPGAAVLSDELPGEAEFSLDLEPVWLWISDGTTAQAYDLRSLQAAGEPGAWTMHPLEGAGGVFEMVFPIDLPGDLSGMLPVEHTEWAGRPALLIEWDGVRYWVDENTGLVLRRVRYGETGEPVEDVSLEKVVYNLEAPPPGWTGENLDGVSFETPPPPPDLNGTLPAPTLETPTSTPTPLSPPSATPAAVSGEPVTITLAGIGTGGQEDIPDSGEVFFTLRSLAAPVERLLARLSLSCLLTEEVCEANWFKDAPPVSDNPLYWSPDGERAVLVDPNGNRLWRYQPPPGDWSVLAENLPVAADIVAWSPDGAWVALTTQSNGSEDSLITLVEPESEPDGARWRTFAQELGGMQIPIGWQDADDLVFLRAETASKGSDIPPVEPGLFRLDISSGEVEKLDLAGNPAWLADYPALSPGGARLALSLAQEDSGLAVYNLESGETDRLNLAGGRPVWSPDEDQLTFLTTREGDSGPLVEVIVADDNGANRRKVFEWISVPQVEWLPDSEHLLISVSPAGDEPPDNRSTFYLVSLETGLARRLLLQGETQEYEFIAPAIRPPE